MFNRVSKTQTVNSYGEWLVHANQHDAVTGAERWRLREETDLYDYRAIKIRLLRLQDLRESKDYRGLLFALHEGIHGNMGGMGNYRLYKRAKSGTKKLVDEYVDEIVHSLNDIHGVAEDIISEQEKRAFFNRANQCFGRSALMLSGGALLGYFHYGVVKTLLEQGVLPSVISGSSAGSITAAVVGTHSETELFDMFAPERLMKEAKLEVGFLNRLLKPMGDRLDASDVIALIEHVIPDLTFEEAYEKTGKHINISVAPAVNHQTSRLLNAITSPNVLIRSAVQASCAVPGVFPPVTLKAKNFKGEFQDYLPSRQWVDGSMSDDLPAKRLARLYGVNHYIVSQVNPLVLPFLADPEKSGVGNILLNPFKAFMKESFQSVNKMRQYLPVSLPKRIAVILDTIYSVYGQNYAADISIVLDKSHVAPVRLMSKPSVEEVLNLMQAGEQATWPKVPRIDNSTKISRALDKILPKYGLD